MTSKSFKLEDLLPAKTAISRAVLASGTPTPRRKIVPQSLSFTIEKKTSAARNKKAVAGLLALLEKSPVSKRGSGITAELSRDRDRGHL